MITGVLIRFFFVLFFFIASCTPQKSTTQSPQFSQRLRGVWQQYLSTIKEGIQQKKERKGLILLKEQMIQLYFQQRDYYPDFPDDLALEIARTLNQLDQHCSQQITHHLIKQSIDLLPKRVVQKPVFMGALDDGKSIFLKLRLRKYPFKWPFKGGRVTSPYGIRKDPFTGATRFHHGIDLGIVAGTPVYASAPGKVLYAGNNGGYGLTVVIQHSKEIVTLYAHLQQIDVKEGATIKGYQQIGLVGSTGRSTGPHLHFEVRRGRQAIDPVFFIQYQGK